MLISASKNVRLYTPLLVQSAIVWYYYYCLCYQCNDNNTYILSVIIITYTKVLVTISTYPSTVMWVFLIYKCANQNTSRSLPTSFLVNVQVN